MSELSSLCPAVTTTSARVVGLRTVLGLPGKARRFLASMRKRSRTFSRILGGKSNTIEDGVRSIFNGAVDMGSGGTLTALVCCPGTGVRRIGQARSGVSS